jgi:hypothetical protein
MVKTVVGVMSRQISAMYVDALIQRAHQLPQKLVVPHASLYILVMHLVMISITRWTAVMMVETVVDVTLTHNSAMYVDALIQMEVAVEQHAHKQQQAQQV